MTSETNREGMTSDSAESSSITYARRGGASEQCSVREPSRIESIFPETLQ